MKVFHWIYYYIFFGWLFEDDVKEETVVDEYCSDESPYRSHGNPSKSDEDNEVSYRDYRHDYGGSYGGSYGSSDSSYSSSSGSSDC